MLCPWDLQVPAGEAALPAGGQPLHVHVRGPFLSAHVGYWLDSRLHGRGACSVALRMVPAHARDGLGLHRVQASVLPGNAASRAILHRAGFTLIGTAPSYLRIAGTWQDHLLYQRLLH